MKTPNTIAAMLLAALSIAVSAPDIHSKNLNTTSPTFKGIVKRTDPGPVIETVKKKLLAKRDSMQFDLKMVERIIPQADKRLGYHISSNESARLAREIAKRNASGDTSTDPKESSLTDPVFLIEPDKKPDKRQAPLTAEERMRLFQQALRWIHSWGQNVFPETEYYQDGRGWYHPYESSKSDIAKGKVSPKLVQLMADSRKDTKKKIAEIDSLLASDKADDMIYSILDKIDSQSRYYSKDRQIKDRFNFKDTLDLPNPLYRDNIIFIDQRPDIQSVGVDYIGYRAEGNDAVKTAILNIIDQDENYIKWDWVTTEEYEKKSESYPYHIEYLSYSQHPEYRVFVQYGDSQPNPDNVDIYTNDGTLVYRRMPLRKGPQMYKVNFREDAVEVIEQLTQEIQKDLLKQAWNNNAYNIKNAGSDVTYAVKYHLGLNKEAERRIKSSSNKVSQKEMQYALASGRKAKNKVVDSSLDAYAEFWGEAARVRNPQALNWIEQVMKDTKTKLANVYKISTDDGLTYNVLFVDSDGQSTYEASLTFGNAVENGKKRPYCSCLKDYSFKPNTSFKATPTPATKRIEPKKYKTESVSTKSFIYKLIARNI